MKYTEPGVLTRIFRYLKIYFFPRTPFERMVRKTGLHYAIKIFQPILTSSDWDKISTERLWKLGLLDDDLDLRDVYRALYHKRVLSMLSAVSSIEECHRLYKKWGARWSELTIPFCERALELAKVTEDLVWVYALTAGRKEIRSKLLEKMLSLARDEMDAKIVYDRASGVLKEQALALWRQYLHIESTQEVSL